MKLLTLSLTILCLALAAPAFAGVIYSDGATNGTTNALFIDGPNPGPFNQSISDGFVATASGTAYSLDFGVWVTPGTTPTTVSWWLGTTAFGSDISSGSIAQVGYTFLFNNGGWDVYDAHVAGLSGSLSAGGSYWLTLGNANDSAGDQFDAWDINNGPANCQFAVGGVPQGGCGYGGEAFTINSSPTPEPGSMMMFGTGILGLAGVLRRKINL